MLVGFHAFGTEQRTVSILLRRVSLKINKFFLSYLPSYRVLPSRSLNKLMFALLKSEALILLFVLLPPFGILNCTVSQSLQMRLSLTFISLTNSFF